MARADNNWRGLLEEKTKCDKKFLEDISRICFEFSKISDKGILRQLSKRVFEKNDADKVFLAEIGRSFVEKDAVIAEKNKIIAEMYIDLKRITDGRAHGDEKTGEEEEERKKKKRNGQRKRQRAAKAAKEKAAKEKEAKEKEAQNVDQRPPPPPPPPQDGVPEEGELVD